MTLSVLIHNIESHFQDIAHCIQQVTALKRWCSPHRHGNAASAWGCESEATKALNFVRLTELIDQTSCFLTCEGQPFPESPRYVILMLHVWLNTLCIRQ